MIDHKPANPDSRAAMHAEIVQRVNKNMTNDAIADELRLARSTMNRRVALAREWARGAGVDMLERRTGRRKVGRSPRRKKEVLSAHEQVVRAGIVRELCGDLAEVEHGERILAAATQRRVA